MFPQNTDFSKGNYLITSNESLNRNEDRIFNREYGDPYRYEKKLDHIYKDSNKTNEGSLSNLNFAYDDDYNKYKRKEVVDRYKTSKMSKMSKMSQMGQENNLEDELSSNLSLNNKEGLTSTSDYKNYNKELSYYRDMIENMHGEIGNLNNKLNELEKNNNTRGVNNSHVSNSGSNSNLSTANFRTNRVDILEKNIESLKDHFDSNLKLKEERMLRLERERDYLYNKTLEMERENKFNTLSYNNNNDLAGVMNINTKNSINIKSETPPLTSVINSVPLTKVKPSTTTTTNKTRSSSADKMRKKVPNTSTSKEPPLRERKTPLKKSVEKNNVRPVVKTKPVEKTKSQPDENLTNVLKENEQLKNKISNLEKSLRSLNDQISLDNLEKKGKDHLRVELEIWKNRSETVAQNYLETISNMKKQLAQDKIYYVDQIKTLQNNCTTQIGNLKNKYQSTLEKNELTIKKLKKENEDLKKKVTKVKEILLPLNTK